MTSKGLDKECEMLCQPKAPGVFRLEESLTHTLVKLGMKYRVGLNVTCSTDIKKTP